MEDLTKAMRDVEGELAAVRRGIAGLRKAFGRRTIALVVIALAMVVVVVAGSRAQASNERRIRESEQRWCPVLTVSLPQPGDPPITTERGRTVVERIRELAAQYHCPPPNGA